MFNVRIEWNNNNNKSVKYIGQVYSGQNARSEKLLTNVKEIEIKHWT